MNSRIKTSEKQLVVRNLTEINQFVEQDNQKQLTDKNSKAFSIAEGTRLIRELKINNTQLLKFLVVMNSTAKT